MAPVDTVDSLAAARRATVMDTLPQRLAPAAVRAAPASGATTDRSSDTTPPRPVRGLIGPTAGDRHLAFRDVGSPLDSLWPVKGPAPLPGS